ncbi:MAG: ATP-binding protein [Acidimicrobiales bacterium]
MERSVLVGAAWLRWVVLAFAAAVTVGNRHRLRHQLLALALLGAMALWAAVAHRLAAGGQWRQAVRREAVAVEVVLVAALIAADGIVLQSRATGQQLAGAVPIAVLLVAGVALGPWWAAGVGCALGAARLAAAAIAGVPDGRQGRELLASLSAVVVWVVVGAVTGGTCRLLRRAQDDLAEARARERVAADLHDTVLQALAVVERRTTDPEVAKVARSAERDLRLYLFGDDRDPGTLPAALRAAAVAVEERWGDLQVSVTVTPDAEAGPATTRAVAAAVGEALTNAAKHGGARSAVVLADLDDATDGLLVTVRDDGTGFDPSLVPAGHGLKGSVIGRARDAGGKAEVVTAVGDGCEVRVCIPRPANLR